MAWWNDRIRIAATLSIAGWVIVFVVGMSIIVPQALPAFGDSSGWIKWVLGWVMIGAAAAATEGARLALELGHDNIEQLIGEKGGAVGVEHVASEKFLQMANHSR